MKTWQRMITLEERDGVWQEPAPGHVESLAMRAGVVEVPVRTGWPGGGCAGGGGMVPVGRAVDALRSGARWAIQTDHAEYFEWIRRHTDSRPELVEIPYDEQFTEAMTNAKTIVEWNSDQAGIIEDCWREIRAIVGE